MSAKTIELEVNRQSRTVSLSLVGLESEVYAESDFISRATKSGRSYFEFIQNEGASVFAPSAWVKVIFTRNGN
jgi:hypothetical protein